MASGCGLMTLRRWSGFSRRATSESWQKGNSAGSLLLGLFRPILFLLLFLFVLLVFLFDVVVGARCGRLARCRYFALHGPADSFLRRCDHYGSNAERALHSDADELCDLFAIVI